MMDPVQGGAGLKSRHVIRADLPQLFIGGHDGTLASSGDKAFLRHRWPHSLLANHSHNLVSIIRLVLNGKCVETATVSALRQPLPGIFT